MEPEKRNAVISLNIASLEAFFNIPAETEIYMIHSASIVTLNPDPNPKVYAVNVDGTQSIINQCLKHHIKKAGLYKLHNDYSYGPVATFNSVDVRDLTKGVIACCDKGRNGE